MADYYRILELTPDATPDEVKRAYRRLARQWHPDANNAADAEERFKQINEAYEVLSDPARRERFDRFGDPDAAFPSPFGGLGDLGEVFESFFGTPFGRGRGTRVRVAQNGADVGARLTLSFEEAVFGTSKTVEVTAERSCERCGGDGCEPGTFRSRCQRCAGTGETRNVRQSIFGTVMTSRPCGECGGAGEAPAVPCTECRGRGRVLRTESLTVQVPAGVNDGSTLRLRGLGEPGVLGGDPGDLYVQLSVDAHPIFERQGDDLVCSLSVPLTQALLGGMVPIETLEEEEQIEIRPGTQSGSVVKLRGKGVPRLEGRGRGDLLVHVSVDIPRSLPAEQRKLIEQLAELRGEETTGRRGLIERLRGPRGSR